MFFFSAKFFPCCVELEPLIINLSRLKEATLKKLGIILSRNAKTTEPHFLKVARYEEGSNPSQQKASFIIKYLFKLEISRQVPNWVMGLWRGRRVCLSDQRSRGKRCGVSTSTILHLHWCIFHFFFFITNLFMSQLIDSNSLNWKKELDNETMNI